jgi:hypothetical protein
MSRRLTIKVTGTSPDREDKHVPGIYAVEVYPGLTDAGAASAALDAFHSTIPVSVLDGFEFTVREGEKALDPDPDLDGYELTRMARFVAKL